jgi:hypothetical protein
MANQNYPRGGRGSQDRGQGYSDGWGNGRQPSRDGGAYQRDSDQGYYDSDRDDYDANKYPTSQGSYGYDADENIYQGEGSSGRYRDGGYQGGQNRRWQDQPGQQGARRDGSPRGQDWGPNGAQSGSVWGDPRRNQPYQSATGSHRGQGDSDAPAMSRGDVPPIGQSHRGRGPKNYQRSDDRIYEDVCDRLFEDNALDASNIYVSVSDREVTLSGEVETKHAKRRAEDCADCCSGVEHVQNNLRVKSSSREEGETAGR